MAQPSKIKVPERYWKTPLLTQGGVLSDPWHKILDDTLAKTWLTLNTDGSVHLQKTGRIQSSTSLSGSADAISGQPAAYIITTAGVDAITLPAPTTAQEGAIIEIWSNTANAHTITAPGAIIASGGASLKTKITLPAGIGAGVVLRAGSGNWHIIRQGFTAVTLT